MKNKTQTSLQMLEQALANMPGDNALGTARSYMARAIEEIARVEKKRVVRAQQQEVVSRWKYDHSAGQMIPPMTEPQRKIAILHINKLIEAEKTKLNKQTTEIEPDETLLD